MGSCWSILKTSEALSSLDSEDAIDEVDFYMFRLYMLVDHAVRDEERRVRGLRVVYQGVKALTGGVSSFCAFCLHFRSRLSRGSICD